MLARQIIDWLTINSKKLHSRHYLWLFNSSVASTDPSSFILIFRFVITAERSVFESISWCAEHHCSWIASVSADYHIFVHQCDHNSGATHHAVNASKGVQTFISLPECLSYVSVSLVYFVSEPLVKLIPRFLLLQVIHRWYDWFTPIVSLELRWLIPTLFPRLLPPVIWVKRLKISFFH